MPPSAVHKLWLGKGKQGTIKCRGIPECNVFHSASVFIGSTLIVHSGTGSRRCLSPVLSQGSRSDLRSPDRSHHPVLKIGTASMFPFRYFLLRKELVRGILAGTGTAGLAKEARASPEDATKPSGPTSVGITSLIVPGQRSQTSSS